MCGANDEPAGQSKTAVEEPHPELGVGLWTDAQILGAITRGVSPDGRPLVRPMGGHASVWTRLTDTDRRDLLAYIRSLPPQEP
jgi:hypothetical protein